jgi:hypothetical protein
VNNVITPTQKKIERSILKKELSQSQFIRPTRLGNNEIYIFNGLEAPNLMQEVGRLRGMAFRDGGYHLDSKNDIDPYDYHDYPCKQLIVWDPNNNEIIGGYRFNYFFDYHTHSNQPAPVITQSLYNLSDEFIADYLPNLIELTRAFIQPKYQVQNLGKKAIFTLDNLFDALGSLVINYPKVEYFFGTITFSTDYNKKIRDLGFHFFNKHLKINNLITPKELFLLETKEEILNQILNGKTKEEDYILLNKIAISEKTTFPALAKTYYKLSDTMQTFDPVYYKFLGSSYAMGILITIKDIIPKIYSRYINSFQNYLKNKKS